MGSLTYADKVELYRKGNYNVRVPPVQVFHWTMEDWIAYIDINGTWEIVSNEN